MTKLSTLKKLNEFVSEIEDPELKVLIDKLAQSYTRRVVANQELYGIFDEIAENFIADLNIIVEYFGNPNELYEKYNDVIEKINTFIEEARKMYASMQEAQQNQFDEAVQQAKEALPMGNALQ